MIEEAAGITKYKSRRRAAELTDQLHHVGDAEQAFFIHLTRQVVWPEDASAAD